MFPIFKRPYTFLFALFFSPLAIAQQSDCISEAALCFQINPLVIKAIIWQESGNKPGAINKNSNRTEDVGLMQINSIHFNALKARGISVKDLRENTCANVFSGSWILKNAIDRYGYTWEGIGNYHSHTPVHHDKYVDRIVGIIARKSHLIENIEVAYQAGMREKFTCQ